LEKKLVDVSSSLGEFIKGLTDLDSSILGNKEIGLLRKKANEEIRLANVKSFDDIFGKRHAEFLSGYRNLLLPDMPVMKTWTDVQKPDAEIARRRVIGKIRICDNEINTWIEPEMLEKGVIFSDLLTAIKKHSKIVSRAFKKFSIKRKPFLSNLIIGQSKLGSFLYIPDGIQPEGIFLIEIEVSDAYSLIPMHLITGIGKSAFCNLVIDIKSKNINKDQSILVIQNDLLLAENAHLSIFQNQDVGREIALFISDHIIESKDATISSFIFDHGSLITDRFLAAKLTGEGGAANITGVYNPKNGQRFYYDTQQIHDASYTKSDLHFKGVLEKNAYSSWKGNILISQNTKSTNGYQSNDNLMIGSFSKAESIPGLEILTDDVRCSHGVTMSNIDKNQMFYLQSRGINKEDAEKLIVDGFLSSAVKRMADKGFEELILNSFED